MPLLPRAVDACIWAEQSPRARRCRPGDLARCTVFPVKLMWLFVSTLIYQRSNLHPFRVGACAPAGVSAGAGGGRRACLSISPTGRRPVLPRNEPVKVERGPAATSLVSRRRRTIGRRAHLADDRRPHSLLTASSGTSGCGGVTPDPAAVQVWPVTVAAAADSCANSCVPKLAESTAGLLNEDVLRSCAESQQLSLGPAARTSTIR